jgi:hypothetical protein
LKSAHAHRIEVIDEGTLRLVGEDGHLHEVNRDGTQQSYDEAGSGRSSHGHQITVIDASGPAFAQTRPYVPHTAEARATSVTLNAQSGVSPAPGRPFKVPFLEAKTVETESDNTGHTHKVKVSPHDYWSGTFSLPGDSHNHRVEDWAVTTEAGHTHTISEPTVPQVRTLVPRLVAYEDRLLKSEVQSPFALNMEMNQGWIEATCATGFSEQIVLGFETGGRVQVPPPEERSGTVGLGPKKDPDHFNLSVRQSRVGFDLVVEARVEDEYTGGVPHQAVTARWNLSADTPSSVDFYTEEDGVAEVRIPTDPNQLSYTVEFTTGSVVRTETFELDSLGQQGGYGIDYGIDYGA